MFDEKIMELELAGRTLKVSTGKISRQSSGAIVIQYGDTVVLSTANRNFNFVHSCPPNLN
ncbi:hypothetical protein CTM86_00540 [Fusobacterium pseudoperiodonticum]|uniref:Uncharacterized protein n=2 Tax=Fusobacterium pseudoperiodonticum TaxID=2663009 RepID=A0AAD0F313_9FUSO|nr:hypothetical protein CTM86_00540 [Fusobacterium pseudoperiodonticum]